jgi:hypothetical protein
MASTNTFLQHTNWVLNAINEPVLTSSNFSSAVGIQLEAQNAVNSTIRDIIDGELEWPFNRTTYSETLTPGTQIYTLQTFRSVDWDSFYVRPIDEITNGSFTSNINNWTDKSAGTGSIAYTSTGNGRMRLTGDGTNGGSAEQAITTVANRAYKLQFRHLTNDVTVKIGTTSAGTEISSTIITLDNAGEGEIQDIDFTASGTSTYIGFANTSTTVCDIDYVKVKENRSPQHLVNTSFDEWRRLYRDNDETLSATFMGYPNKVFRTQNDEYGLSRVPLQANWEVTYDYWTSPSDLSAHSSTTVIDDRWSWLIVEGAKRYVYETLSDPAFHDRAVQKFNAGLKRMRIELINKEDVMNPHINYSAWI